MNSEHQDGKTEPAATIRDSGIGKSDGANQLRNAAIIDSHANIPHNSKLLGKLVDAAQTSKATVK
jgi:hypothetical protein